MNDIQIVENKSYPKSKWITFAPNNTEKKYGVLFPFSEADTTYLLTHPNLTITWLRDLFALKSHINPVAKYYDDELRNPTIDEYLIMNKLFEIAHIKYNKKRKCIISLKNNGQT